MFILAVTRGYLPAGNSCSAICFIEVSRKRPAYCGPEDFQAICCLAADPLLVVICSTGLRLREATNLTWGDIDFAARQIHVTRKSAGSRVQSWTTPKDHEKRILPAPRQAIDLLTERQAKAPDACPYVFMAAARWPYDGRQVLAGTWFPRRNLTNNLLRRFKR